MQTLNAFLSRLTFLSGGYSDIKKVNDQLSGATINTAIEAIGSLTDLMKSFLLYAGGIVIAIAIVKLIISLGQHDSGARVKASMMLALGIVFVASDAVLEYLDIKNTAMKAEDILTRLSTLASSTLKIAGAAVIAVSILMLLLSFANEDPRDQLESSKAIGISIGLYLAGSVISAVTDIIISSGTDIPIGQSIFQTVIQFICGVAAFIGIILMVFGTYYLIMGMKDMDPRAQQKGATLLAIGFTLTMLNVILVKIGIVDSSILPKPTPSGSGTPTRRPDLHSGAIFEDYMN